MALLCQIAGRSRRWPVRLAQALCCLILFLGWQAILGYSSGLAQLVIWGADYTAMALSTALAFSLLALGSLFAHSDIGIMNLVASPGNAGMTVRRLIPLACLLPVLLGLIIQYCQSRGVFSESVGESLLAVANLTIMTACILAVGRQAWRREGEIAENRRQLAQALSDKETLLQELNHRTKNNMYLISSLLSLQAESSEQPAVRAALLDVSNRIQSMTLVHQRLHQGEGLNSIDLADFLGELATHTVQSRQPQGPAIQLDTDMAPVKVPVSLATPLGLVVNELIMNSCKYAFPAAAANPAPLILLSLRSVGTSLECRVRDNGIGLPADFGGRNHGLGMQLMESLVQAQLGGSLAIATNQGVDAFVKIPLK
jgi:two-component sensor histidine kinase